MQIIEFNEQQNKIVFSLRAFHDPSERMIEIFNKHNLQIPQDAIRLAFSGDDYDRSEITLTSWSDIFKFLVAYIIECASGDNKLFDKYSRHTLVAIANTKSEINSEFIGKFKSCLLNKNQELKLIQQKLLEIAKLLNVQLTIAKEYGTQNVNDLVESNKDLMLKIDTSYSLLIAQTHKRRNDCNQLVPMVNKLIQEKNVTDTELKKIIEPEQECAAKYRGDHTKFVTVYNSDIEKLAISVKTVLHDIDKYSTLINANKKTPISELEKQIFKYLSFKSPLVWVIHDKTLSDEQKVNLISILAYKNPIGSTEKSIDVLSGKPEYATVRPRSPLFHAIEYASPIVVKAILDKITDIESLRYNPIARYLSSHELDNTKNALHVAALRGNPEIIKLLLARKVNVNAKLSNSATALHLVQDAECARLLLLAGADPNAKDENGNTPLHQLCIQTLERYLWNDGESQQKAKKNIATIAVFLEKPYKTQLNAQNNYGYTPLHYAANLPHGDIHEEQVIERIRLLCESGANPNIVTYQGTPRYQTCYSSYNSYASKEYNLTPAEQTTPLLLIFDDLEHPFRNNDNNIDLITKLTKLLQSFSANITASDNAGETVLHKAISSHTPLVVDFLLTLPQKESLINFQSDSHHETPLHAAVSCLGCTIYTDENELILNNLLKYGANPLAVFYDKQENAVSVYMRCVQAVNERRKNSPFDRSYNDYLQQTLPILEKAETAAINNCILTATNDLAQLRVQVEKLDTSPSSSSSSSAINNCTSTAANDPSQLRVQIEKYTSLSSSSSPSQQTTDVAIDTINKELNTKVVNLETLAKAFPQINQSLAMLSLFHAEREILHLDKLSNINVPLNIIQQARELWRKSGFLDDSLLHIQLKSILFNLGNKCLLLPAKNPHAKQINIATAIACFLAANRESQKTSDYSYHGLLLELMGLKLNHTNETPNELMKHYPEKYNDAWQLINKQAVKMFFDGNNFTDKTFFSKAKFKKCGLTKHGDQFIFFGLRPMPTSSAYRAQDDNQRIHEMPIPPNL